MAKTKKFHNGPSLVQFIIDQNATVEDVLQGLRLNNQMMIDAAIKTCKQELLLEPAAVLAEVQNAIGKPKRSTPSEAEIKKFDAKIELNFQKEFNANMKNLLLGYCNNAGVCVTASADDTLFTYGVKSGDAKSIIEKCKGIAGLTVKLSK